MLSPPNVAHRGRGCKGVEKRGEGERGKVVVDSMARNDALPPHAHRPLFSRKPRDCNCFSTTLRHSTELLKKVCPGLREWSLNLPSAFYATYCMDAQSSKILKVTCRRGITFEMKQIPDIPEAFLPLVCEKHWMPQKCSWRLHDVICCFRGRNSCKDEVTK